MFLRRRGREGTIFLFITKVIIKSLFKVLSSATLILEPNGRARLGVTTHSQKAYLFFNFCFRRFEISSDTTSHGMLDSNRLKPQAV